MRPGLLLHEKVRFDSFQLSQIIWDFANHFWRATTIYYLLPYYLLYTFSLKIFYKILIWTKTTSICRLKVSSFEINSWLYLTKISLIKFHVLIWILHILKVDVDNEIDLGKTTKKNQKKPRKFSEPGINCSSTHLHPLIVTAL